ncbi:MAG: DUF4248 domain-containing protein [Tannerellaceae bacterium]|jgi:hypothetical protein|nr:DUF4248 domain-containing protein [Tannerellaceae bacterium]
METFKYKAYGLQELAQLYFPGSTPQSASTQLRKWMRIKALDQKLKAASYVYGQKILTPLQVKVIVEHIGEPETV